MESTSGDWSSNIHQKALISTVLFKIDSGRSSQSKRELQLLQNLPSGSKVKMSALKCHTMSKEIQEVIVDFRDITSKDNNIELEMIGFEKFDLLNYSKVS